MLRKLLNVNSLQFADIYIYFLFVFIFMYLFILFRLFCEGVTDLMVGDTARGDGEGEA